MPTSATLRACNFRVFLQAAGRMSLTPRSRARPNCPHGRAQPIGLLPPPHGGRVAAPAAGPLRQRTGLGLGATAAHRPRRPATGARAGETRRGPPVELRVPTRSRPSAVGAGDPVHRAPVLRGPAHGAARPSLRRAGAAVAAARRAVDRPERRAAVDPVAGSLHRRKKLDGAALARGAHRAGAGRLDAAGRELPAAPRNRGPGRRLAGQPGRGAGAIAARRQLAQSAAAGGRAGPYAARRRGRGSARRTEQCATMAAGGQVRARPVGAADATVGDDRRRRFDAVGED